MNKLSINHLTQYTYSEKVVLNPHSFFLCPLSKSYLNLLNYNIKLHPEPVNVEQRQNIDNNPFYLAWFEGETDQLKVEVEMELQLKPFNPFAFILHHDFTEKFESLPGKDEFENLYPKAERRILSPALYVKQENSSFRDLLHELRIQQRGLIPFLMLLLEHIHLKWNHIIREDENLWSAQKTFECKKGSCRDLSWMLIQMLRSIGLASKFVSGYAYNPALEEGHELHAWVEVYLPGAGWVGIDPSLGLFADENYIPLAISSVPRLTLPVVGTYGGAANSKLFTEVRINT
jgi:hypothetical protein